MPRLLSRRRYRFAALAPAAHALAARRRTAQDLLNAERPGDVVGRTGLDAGQTMLDVAERRQQDEPIGGRASAQTLRTTVDAGISGPRRPPMRFHGPGVELWWDGAPT